MFDGLHLCHDLYQVIHTSILLLGIIWLSSIFSNFCCEPILVHYRKDPTLWPNDSAIYEILTTSQSLNQTCYIFLSISQVCCQTSNCGKGCGSPMEFNASKNDHISSWHFAWQCLSGIKCTFQGLLRQKRAINILTKKPTAHESGHDQTWAGMWMIHWEIFYILQCFLPWGRGGGVLSLEKGTNCGLTSWELWLSWADMAKRKRGGPEWSCHSLKY